MKTLCILFLCFTFFSTAVAIEPIGSLGKGVLHKISFLPDGKILRVLANRLEIAYPKTNTTLAIFAERTEKMGKVSVSSDGSQLVTLTDRSVERWHIPTRRKVHQWTQPINRHSAVVSRNLTVLVDHSGRNIRFWNAETGESLGKIEWIQDPVSVFFALSSDGRQLLASHTRLIEDLGGDEIWGLTTEIWDVTARQRLGILDMPDRVLHSSPFSVIEAVFSADGHWLITADTLNQVTLWNAQNLEKVRSWNVMGDVQQISFSPGGRRVYIAVGRSGSPRQAHRVRAWDVETGEQLNEFGDETIYLEGFSISADEKLAVLWYTGGFVALWDIEPSHRLALSTDYVAPAWGVITPDGRTLVSFVGAAVTIWDMQTQSLRKIIFPHRVLRRLAMSPNGTVFAVDQDPWIEIRSVDSGEVVSKIPNDRGSRPFTFSKDGKRLAMGEGRGVVIYNIENPENPEALAPQVPNANRGAVMWVIFSEDDRYLVTSDSKEWIQLWERNAGQYVHRHSWQPQLSQIDSLAFAPGRDAPDLLIGGLHQIQVWEIDDAAPEQSWVIQARPPTRFIRFSDGLRQSDYLLVNKDNRLQIWDWTAKTPIVHTDIPSYFAVNADGSVLLTWDNVSYQTRTWNIHPELPAKPVAVEPDGKQLAQWGAVKRTALLQNYPNPFNPETWIPFRLAHDADVTIQIYDARGLLVRTLPLGRLKTGVYDDREKAAYWDGRSETGEAVSSGLYFYRLSAGKFTEIHRMALVK
ncbi:MAG: hypothetical protein O7E52_07335 [Candidatus Poribacteria bacterium]|nr:hypothetical protein [Candidatus Poribacteria bacterium]